MRSQSATTLSQENVVALPSRSCETVAMRPSELLDLLPFRPGTIGAVEIKPLTTYRDARGSLCELFRQDEMGADVFPVMGYVSETAPGATRGPHEHLQQTDFFCFLGAATFHLYLWDNRAESPTYLCHEIAILPSGKPMSVLIPPGIVHAYRNVGNAPGVVINCPNRLFRGEGRSDPIDEIRHEDDPKSPFHLIDSVRAPSAID